jgi:hypothetical protein
VKRRELIMLLGGAAACRVGKGALFAPSAWAKSCARRGHADTIRQSILPTLQRSNEVIE